MCSDKGRTIRRFGDHLIGCNPRPIKADVGQRSEWLNRQRTPTFYDFLIVQVLTAMVMIAAGLRKVRGIEGSLRPKLFPTSVKREFLSGSPIDTSGGFDISRRCRDVNRDRSGGRWSVRWAMPLSSPVMRCLRGSAIYAVGWQSPLRPDACQRPQLWVRQTTRSDTLHPSPQAALE
jgi:hypothetical protein